MRSVFVLASAATIAGSRANVFAPIPVVADRRTAGLPNWASDAY